MVVYISCFCFGRRFFLKRLFLLVLILGWIGSHVVADLVGYWPLDGDGKDLSGKGHDGTINGNVAPVMDRFGNPAGAMYFAGGSGDNINVGDSPDFQMTGAMTITAWVYLDSTNPLHGARNGRIIAKMAGGGSRSWSSGIEKSIGGIPVPSTVQVASNGNTVVSLSDEASLPLDRWVHYAGIYTPEESLAVYLNGELAAIRTDGIPASQYSTNGQAVLIGHRPGCGDCGWYGILDEVRLYNEALSESQIRSIMGGGRVNQKPEVDAGQDIVLFWPDTTFVLDATVVDDGLGDPNGTIDYIWSILDGPGRVTFEPNPFVEDPTVTFSTLGEYTLVLTATDGELGGCDTVVVRVIEPFCPVGDLNGDCKVDLGDLLIMSGVWLGDDDTADINHTNIVDAADFSLLAQDWRIEKTRLPLVINEVLARNAAVEPPDPQGQYDDWIEIHNYGDEPIDIGGMYLTDDLERPTLWEIPVNQPENTTIEGRGYLVIWADGDINDSGLHASFDIDADEGDEVGFYDIDGHTLIDSIEFGAQATNVSYGRQPDAGKTFRTLNPSPGASNNDRFLGVVATTQFHPEHGFFDAPFEVTLSTETSEATIYFTTDCGDPVFPDGTPSPTAQVYNAATNKPMITATTCLRAAAILGPGWKPSPVITNTYIFLDDVVTQTRPAGYPTSWHYEMDSNVVNHPAYAGRIRGDLKSIPTLSIVADRNDLLGSGGVIGAAAASIEVEASAEMIPPDGQDGFQINCGLVPHSHVNEKRSLRLYFRSQYGQARLQYPVFDDAPEHAESAANEFDRLILRAGGNDQLRANSAGRQVDRVPQGVKASYLTDQLARDSQIAMSGYGSHGTFVHLYLNGLYWGLYNIVERPDAFFTSIYFGGEKKDWFAANHSGDISGDDTRFDFLHNNRSDWNIVREYLDVDQFCDYILYYLYSGAGDWPNNNWYAGNRNVPIGGRIQYYIWDAEDSWLHVWKNEGHSYHRSNEGAWIHPVLLGKGGLTNGNDLISKLWREVDNQSDFLIQFADHVYRHCFNNGELTDAKTMDRWDNLCAAIEGGVIAESARWGRFRANPGRYEHGPLPDVWTREDWLWYTNYVRRLMDGNVDRLIAALRDTTTAGPVLVDHPLYYPLTDPPEFLVNGSPIHSGYISEGDVLTMVNRNPSGTIYYTINGTDPRLTGGLINTTDVVTYSMGIPLNRTTRIKARVLNGGEWSALHDTVYALPAVAAKLRLTEIMYHPADPPQGSVYSDEDFEFIELKHIGDPNDPTETPINLNLVRFTSGIEYTFDASVILNPNDYVLVVRNPTAFATRYDTTGINIAPGQYNGSLDNGGEKIALEDALGAAIHCFSYEDDWYRGTDGDGLSLTLRNPWSTEPDDWGRLGCWRASSVLHGAPGRDDEGVGAGDVVINEVLSHSSSEPYDWIELCNLTDQAVHLGGMYLSNSSASLRKFRILDGTILGSKGASDNGDYLVFDETELGFPLSENGDDVYLSQDVSGVLAILAEEHFDAAESDVAFGRHSKSALDGGVNFVAMSKNTPGVENLYPPKVGPVVISEIAYHPASNGDAEYVELLNISAVDSVTLFEGGVPWRFVDHPETAKRGLEFEILNKDGLPVTLGPGDYLLLVKDLNAFISVFENPPANVAVLDWDSPLSDDTIGRLDNGGADILELQKPGEPGYYIRIDRVNYDDGYPWPTEPDGSDMAVLQRRKRDGYGNDAGNWQVSVPTPGH